MISTDIFQAIAPESGLEWLEINGIKSHDVGVIVASSKSMARAVEGYEAINVPGRAPLFGSDPVYDNIDISYDLRLLPDPEIEGGAIVDVSLVDEAVLGNESLAGIASAPRWVANWIRGTGGYQIIRDSYNPGYFRKGFATNQIPIERVIKNFGRASINFSCDPFLYPDTGNDVITLTASGTVDNPEWYESLPYIKCHGNGNVTLTVNGQTISITGVSGYVEVDCESMDCHKGSQNLNGNMSPANFPTFLPGENSVSFTGCEKVEIIPRWRTL